VLACTHQSQFDLVLNILDADDRCHIPMTQKCGNDLFGEAFDLLALGCRQRQITGMTWFTVCILQIRQHNGIANLGGVEIHHLSIAPNDADRTQIVQIHLKSP